MNLRKTESILAYFTLGFVALYLPVETYYSWGYGLLSPFYLVDVIAIALLTWGAVRSLRAAPEPRPEILCAAYAWNAANAWRAAAGRIGEVQRGGQLDFGATELWIVLVSTALILGCFALSLLLVTRARARVAVS